jgi:hypothetical protein
MGRSGMKREDVLKLQIKNPQIKNPQLKNFLVVPKEHAEIKKTVSVNNFIPNTFTPNIFQTIL